MRRIGLSVLAAICLLLIEVRPGSHYAAEPQIQQPEFVADEVIVKFRDGVDEFTKDMARFRAAGSRKKLFRYVRGLEVIKLHRGVSVEEAITLIKEIPGVEYAEPNYKLQLIAAPKITAVPNDPSFGSLWGLTKINAPAAWDTTRGNNSLVIATLDTGVDYTHPDLAANIWRNTADCNINGIDDDGNGYIDDCHGIDTANNDSDPRDDHTHGTHVAGTIGAVGNNGIGVVGVNWNVKIMACKFFDASGSATTEGAIECLEYVKMMKERGVNIVATSNSWGGGEFSQALYDTIDAQRQAGILTIAGAGNGNIFGIGQNNDSIPFYPCSFYLPNIVCVAATASNDSKGSFSNFGRRSVHVGAPGVSILSTIPGNSYGTQSGTSMATPHVSGLTALLKAQDQNRDWRAIKNLILTGGNTISSMSNTISGKRINANGSMNCSNTVVQSRLRPIGTTISTSPGVPVHLGYAHVRCANGNGNVNVTVSPGTETITLLDDGTGGDFAAGDGIYSAEWLAQAAGTYTLTFPGNDKVTVNIVNATISVTPSSIDFGNVAVGTSADRSFTVTNIGGGVLSGSASTNAPYSISSGGSYSLSAGQSQNVTVRFSPNALGTHLGNVNFTGGSGATRSITGMAVPPANIALGYNGLLRDRVGQGDLALGPDNALDGTFTVALLSGSGNRTVTKLELNRTGGGNWDTVAGGGFYWALGAASSLDAALYNASNTSVNFNLPEGEVFNIFASNQNGVLYTPGSTFTLKATFADGTTATASTILPPSPPPPNIALGYNGLLRDRVGQGDLALGPDNALDGTFTVALLSGSGNRTVTKLELSRTGGGNWDTVAGGGFYWALGVASSLDAALYNASNTSVNFNLPEGEVFNIFASNQNGVLYTPGSTFTLKATFADGTTATASTTLPPSPPPPNIALGYNGLLRDRVGQGDLALGPDNALDGTFTVALLSGSGNRTVTKLELSRTGGGNWDTVAGGGFYWALGVASSLDAALYNASNTSVNFNLPEGEVFNIFASNQNGVLYTPGSTFTLKATFADGTTATASTSVSTITAGTVPLRLEGVPRLSRNRIATLNSAHVK